MNSYPYVDTGSAIQPNWDSINSGTPIHQSIHGTNKLPSIDDNLTVKIRLKIGDEIVSLDEVFDVLLTEDQKQVLLDKIKINRALEKL